MMSKKIIFILLFVVSILSCLVGCADDKEKSMTINMNEITMNIGEVVELEVSNASGDVIFSSSDENVVKVVDGKITAVSSGSVIITVSDDNESLTCSVIVLSTESTGVYLVSVESEVVELIIGDEYQLEPKLLKGQELVENAKFNYTSMDETVVQVEDGKIKTLKAGETFVQIDAADYEKTSKIIKVVVSNDFTIDLSEVNLTLSKSEILNYVTSKEVSYVVKDNGNVINANELTVSISDESIVRVEKIADKYLIEALNFGEAKVTFSYKKADGSETISYVNVLVEKPVIKFDDEYYFSTVNGLVDFSQYDFTQYSIDFDSSECDKVYDEFGNVFPLVANSEKSVVAIKPNNIAENGETRKMFYDMSEFIVSIDIVQCTLAIRTVEDFLSMKDLLKVKTADDNKIYQRVDGYVLLVNDLDFTGVEYKPFCGFSDLDDFGGRCGWNAIFEGNNKVLKNIKLGSEDHKDWNSIFGNVGWDAEIRNLAIVDCTFADGATGAVLADYFHGVASNVFISTTLVNEDDTGYIERKCCGFSIATPYKYATIEEVTIVVKECLQNGDNYVISGGPVYKEANRHMTYNLVKDQINNMVCIGGGDASYLIYEQNLDGASEDELADLSEIKLNNPLEYLLNNFVTNYETIVNAATAIISNNGSTSFETVDGKLQVKFNGTLVYSE